MADFAELDRATLEAMRRDPRMGPAALERIERALGNVAPASVQKPATASTVDAGEPKRKRSHVLGRMNKTEARYLAQRIEPRLRSGESLRCHHEKVKLRLADGTWYTPDFFEELADGRVWVHEVKGGKIWDDAAVKFKVAAEQFPHWRWSKVQWKDREWRVLRDYCPWSDP